MALRTNTKTVRCNAGCFDASIDRSLRSVKRLFFVLVEGSTIMSQTSRKQHNKILIYEPHIE